MLQQQIEGKYALLGQLEDQGSAEVYKVRHLFLEEVRLITVVHPPSLAMTEEVTERFLRDARAAIKLRHPNIAQLHDFSIDEEGTAYIVTEFIEGLTLEEALAQEGPPPVELTLDDRPPGAPRARLSPPGGDGPPRHLARQADADPRRGRPRAGQVGGPRHGPGARRERRPAGRGRRLPRPAEICLAGAVQRRRRGDGRRPRRSLLVRRRALRAADRPLSDRRDATPSR